MIASRARALLSVALAHACLLAVLAGTPPAYADTGSATVAAPDAVLYPGCLDYPYQYSLDLPMGTTSWSLSIQAFGPGWSPAAADYRYGFVEDPPPGTGSLFLCQSLDGPGMYTLQSQLTYTDEDGNEHSTMLADDTFRMRLPGTRTQLSASPQVPEDGQVVRYLITSKVQRPTGYVANRSAAVRLERYVNQRWTLVAGSATTTDSYGKATFRMRWHAGSRHRYRAVTTATAGSVRSQSSTIVVPAETSPPPPPPSPTLRVSPSRAITGEKQTVSGVLGTSGSRTVLLQRYASVRWVNLQRGTTARTGAFTFTMTAGTASRTLRVLAPATSRRPKVVTPTRSAVVVRQSASIWLPSSTLQLGRSYQLSISFTPTRVGRPALLQRWTGSSWETVQRGVQNRFGRYVSSLSPDVVGAQSYRAVASAFNGAAKSVSAARKVTVTANAVTWISRNTTTVAADGHSLDPSLSSNGNLVAFASESGNIVEGDDNGQWDVFVLDRTTNTTSLISRGVGQTLGDGGSGAPSISADGRYVAFASTATNLVDGDSNGKPDIFLHDRSSGQTTRVTTGLGAAPAEGSSYNPSISGDGRVVAFESDASNLTPGDTNAKGDVFIWDRTSGVISLVSHGDGVPGNEQSLDAAVSADGRFVAYRSWASNLADNDTNGIGDVFVWESSEDSSELVSRGANSEPSNGTSWSPTISANGQVVAYTTDATNIAGEIGYHRLIAWDRGTQTSTASPVITPGSCCDGPSYSWAYEPSISADGLRIAFEFSGQLGVNEPQRSDVYVWSRASGALQRASMTQSGAYPDSDSLRPALSGDGRSVAYFSAATDIVPDDSNGLVDVFLTRLT